MKGYPARGELWWCELEAVGRRPVVVLSRDAAIPRLGRALVAPCTTTVRTLPSEVVLEPGEDPIPRRCAVNLDSVESVSLGVLVEPSHRGLVDRVIAHEGGAIDPARDDRDVPGRAPPGRRGSP